MDSNSPRHERYSHYLAFQEKPTFSYRSRFSPLSEHLRAFLCRRESDTSVHSATSDAASPAAAAAAFQAAIGHQQQLLQSHQQHQQQQQFAFPCPTTGPHGGGRLGHAPSSLLQAACMSSSSSTLSTASMPPTLFNVAAGGETMGIGGGLSGLEMDRHAASAFGSIGSLASLSSPLSMASSAPPLPMDLSSHAHAAAGFGPSAAPHAHHPLSLTFQHQFQHAAAAPPAQSPFSSACASASACVARKEHPSGSKKLRAKEQMLCAVCGDVASVLPCPLTSP